MTIDETLLEILVCPADKSPLRLAAPELVAQLNARIESGSLLNKAGTAVKHKLEAGLLRADEKVLYPVRDDIPVLLIDEGIELGE